MSQVSPFFRRSTNSFIHFCPGCEDTHNLPDSWQFNNNLLKPSFSPSFRHGGVKRLLVNGRWQGGWIKDKNGNPEKFVCHYILTDGILHYQNDCTHRYKGQSIPLPKLPLEMQDKNYAKN